MSGAAARPVGSCAKRSLDFTSAVLGWDGCSGVRSALVASAAALASAPFSAMYIRSCFVLRNALSFCYRVEGAG